MKCLLWMLYGAGGVLAAALGLIVLRYILMPLGWVISWYWDWVSTSFSSDEYVFYELLLAVTPIIMVIAAVAGLLLCLGGVK